MSSLSYKSIFGGDEPSNPKPAQQRPLKHAPINFVKPKSETSKFVSAGHIPESQIPALDKGGLGAPAMKPIKPMRTPNRFPSHGKDLKPLKPTAAGDDPIPSLSPVCSAMSFLKKHASANFKGVITEGPSPYLKFPESGPYYPPPGPFQSNLSSILDDVPAAPRTETRVENGHTHVTIYIQRKRKLDTPDDEYIKRKNQRMLDENRISYPFYRSDGELMASGWAQAALEEKRLKNLMAGKDVRMTGVDSDASTCSDESFDQFDSEEEESDEELDSEDVGYTARRGSYTLDWLEAEFAGNSSRGREQSLDSAYYTGGTSEQLPTTPQDSSVPRAPSRCPSPAESLESYVSYATPDEHREIVDYHTVKEDPDHIPFLRLAHHAARLVDAWDDPLYDV